MMDGLSEWRTYCGFSVWFLSPEWMWGLNLSWCCSGWRSPGGLRASGSHHIPQGCQETLDRCFLRPIQTRHCLPTPLQCQRASHSSGTAHSCPSVWGVHVWVPQLFFSICLASRLWRRNIVTAADSNLSLFLLISAGCPTWLTYHHLGDFW